MIRDLAVVIPAFQTPALVLKKCLDSVLHQIRSEDLIEILVVDSSSASLAEELSIYKDRVTFFFTGKRMFAGEARNFGASHTQKKTIAFLDSDCLWSEHWLATAERLMAKYPDWLAFNGQVRFENPNCKWAFALHLMEFHEFLGTREMNQRFLHSGNLLIRSSFFHKVGGFRPDWKACEDIGFLQNIENSNETQREIRFVPDLTIVHTAHLIEKEKIFEKVCFVGYWRGFYDRQLPKRFRVSSTKYFSYIQPILGGVFWAIILFRSMMLRSTALGDIIIQSPRILRLTRLWAPSFRSGLEKSKL